MSNPNPTNIVASVEAKLKNITTERQIDYRFILIRYATERFFYRLSISPYANQFVLKGGNLFIIWQHGRDYRPTIDSDMICFGNATPEHLRQVFSELCTMNDVPNDGMVFDPDELRAFRQRGFLECRGKPRIACADIPAAQNLFASAPDQMDDCGTDAGCAVDVQRMASLDAFLVDEDHCQRILAENVHDFR